MPDTLEYDAATFFHLVPVTQTTPPLPTRWWTGHGQLAFDVGDGNGEQTWQGSEFGDRQIMGITSIEASADGVPGRMSVSIGIDEAQDDIRHSVTARDLGPVAVSIYFGFRETGASQWTLLSDGAAPKTVKGRSAQSTFENGVWSFEVESRTHDADRLVVDIWSHSVHSAKHSGDDFFEFAADIEAGLDFDWPP